MTKIDTSGIEISDETRILKHAFASMVIGHATSIRSALDYGCREVFGKPIDGIRIGSQVDTMRNATEHAAYAICDYMEESIYEDLLAHDIFGESEPEVVDAYDCHPLATMKRKQDKLKIALETSMDVDRNAY